jgi:hypothetical protein
VAVASSNRSEKLGGILQAFISWIGDRRAKMTPAAWWRCARFR